MKYLLSVLALAVLACGATLPTQPAPVDTISPPVMVVRVLPTLTPFVPVMEQVVTLGKLNVRSCPSTLTCGAIGVLDEGVIVTVGEMIVNDDNNCHKWYPVQWKTQVGYICQEWTSGK